MVESSAKAAGHAIHQQLIVFPLGLLATAVVFDILQLITGNDGFTTASYYMIAAGILSGLLAAVFGVIDYLGVPAGTRARRVGAAHGVGNVVVVALFAVSWLLRGNEPGHVPTTAALVLGLAAALLAVVTGWLGGELVGRLGVGVDPDADVNAPASFETGIRLGRGGDKPLAHR
ncbi:MAG TPA: DUF2231 domain-containing protein [Geodermatophilus sp.]|nr:DUF2231 domain-containing protein [Geodermatophilus sp.]